MIAHQPRRRRWIVSAGDGLMGVLVRGMAALLLVLAVGACSSPELSAQRAEDRRDAEIGAIEAQKRCAG